MLIPCSVNGIICDAMIDTGSDVCVINPHQLSKLGHFQTGPVSAPRWFGCADSSHFMPSEGQCMVLLRIADVSHVTQAVILPQSNFPIILGIQEVQKFFMRTNHDSMSIDMVSGASIPFKLSTAGPSVLAITDNVGVWRVAHHAHIPPGVTSLIHVHCTEGHTPGDGNNMFISDLDDEWSHNIDILCEAVSVNDETGDLYVPICNIRSQERHIPAGLRVMTSVPVNAPI